MACPRPTLPPGRATGNGSRRPASRGPIRLGDRLIEAGLITCGELDSTLELLRENGLSKRRLGRTLVDLGFLSDRELTKILGVHFGMPVATFPVSDADQAAIKGLPADFARRHRIIPCRLSGNSLSVAAPGPLDSEVVNELGRLTKHSVVIHLASERELEAALAKFSPPPCSGSPRTTSTRLCKELERVRREKERVMAAVAKFSEEVLAWDQAMS